jgi:hypothetical protein
MTLTKFNEIVADLRTTLGKQCKLVVSPDGADQIVIRYINSEDMFVCHFSFRINTVNRNGAVAFVITFIESDYEHQHCETNEKAIAKTIVKTFEQEI